ncbi:Flagellar basal-body rod protein FlgC [Fundidesulfovibrio magnetotacticus]|uniref:Flagellar basal-body rod protein FlgC n=1 Tax=Fundidesulfovibrio magnetotacticus TaxID=2730080 RepID=A0A6V8LV98_9BACT|nr:flagellar basal body rod protein FlgC [Fundidesulfovibrio magnetotacticus]GFK93746.1 Flagellar basal-body rod protein FlgC [Fundidesulfovibrio magnetotacticus]
MDFMTALDIGASALTAQRTYMNVISMNLANAKTTRTMDGQGPYQRKSVALQSTQATPFGKAMNAALTQELQGVRVTGIVADQRPPKQVYEPGHPDADQNGYVQYPDINVVEEMANMIQATRGYEANTTSVNTIKAMYNKALEIGR